METVFVNFRLKEWGFYSLQSLTAHVVLNLFIPSAYSYAQNGWPLIFHCCRWRAMPGASIRRRDATDSETV